MNDSCRTFSATSRQQPRIVRAIHFAHSAGADQRNDFVRTKLGVCGEGHWAARLYRRNCGEFNNPRNHETESVAGGGGEGQREQRFLLEFVGFGRAGGGAGAGGAFHRAQA